MEKVVLRHLKGSKSGSVEEFPLAQVTELTLGRDPMAQVRFDPDKDDLVGRQHARIVKDPKEAARFTLTDLNSRNGTFLNKLRVVGTMPLVPGDVIGLGAGGPEIQFDLDPLPAAYVKATRLAVGGEPSVAETRAQSPAGAPAAGGGATAKATVGKATVERMIGETKQEGRRNVMAVLVLAVIALAGLGYWLKTRSDASASENRASADSLRGATERAVNLGKMLTPAEVAERNAPAVVRIDFSWNLIYAPTGAQVFHRYVPNKVKIGGRTVQLIANGGEEVPAFISVGEGTVEPSLSVGGGGAPISVNGGGSGFVVTSDGFILTNRHVAANWRAPYRFPDDMIGVMVDEEGRILLDRQNQPILTRAPSRWFPSETKQFGPKRELDVFRGRQEYLLVRFPKNTTPVEANVQRVSDQHDVALIKVSTPASLRKTELFDSYDVTKVGDQVTVMGYPSVSNNVIAVVKSRDMFNRDEQTRVVPDPTVSVGNIGKILRAADGLASQSVLEFAPNGDTYQLTINSTGGGNSGGPMFDASGRVIGIYFAGKVADAQISFSVPIRYGIDLMSVAPNTK
jgi:serine protease Do